MTPYEPTKEAVDRECRLLPTVLDHEARVNPERVFASQPLTHNLDDGLRDVTFLEVQRAVDALAWWLRDTVGTSESFKTLTYVGVDDLRYVLFFFACIKTGHKALFISPRNTAEQNVRLTKTTDCRLLYHSAEQAHIAEKVIHLAEGPLSIVPIDRFDRWLNAYSKPYPYTKTFEEARFEPVVVLQSSGSTGPPKAIVQNHQFFINYQKQPPTPDGRPIVGFSPFDFEGGGWFFAAFPGFHLGGVLALSVMTTYSRSAAILLSPPGRPPTTEIALKLLALRKVRTFYSPPSIIEGLVRLPDGLSFVKQLDWLIYSGGPLTQSAGDQLTKSVLIGSYYGSTETSLVTTYRSNPEDWQWMEFHTSAGATFEAEIDGLSELVLYQDAQADKYRPIGGTILRNEPFYRTKDLWLPHPSKANLWRFYGRKDDIIVFSTGQKWNPVPSEHHIMSCTKAEGVLIAGTGRPEAALFIEMATKPEEEPGLLNDIWQFIEEANDRTQRYGRISRSRVIFVKPGTLLRTAKGTVVRRLSIELLSEQMERLYLDDFKENETSLNGHGSDTVSQQPLPDNLTSIVRGCVQQISTVRDAPDDADLFVRGLDSLEASDIARSLKLALKPYATISMLSFIGSHLIFEHPTISWLAEAIMGRLTGQASELPGRQTFSGLLDKYETILSKNVPSRLSDDGPRSMSKFAVTGTTGSLGSHLLRALLDDQRVSSVICLNRDSKAEARLHAQTHPHSAKASFITIDITKPNLALSSNDLSNLEKVDAILHCAWEVNFNRSLDTFDPQVAALSDLVTIALAGPQKSRLFFVSSISAAAPDASEVASTGCVPETIVAEPKGASVSSRMGYAASKNVGEHLLSFAARKHNLHATVLRVGQIAGSSPSSKYASVWNRREWLPSLIDTSNNLGLIPDEQPAVDWVPVDAVANTIVDLVAHDIAQSSFTVYNIVNPHPVQWATVKEAIASMLSSKADAVPFSKWLDALKKHDSEAAANLESYPSLKILPFYERNSVSTETGRNVSTALACGASSTLAALPAVDNGQMKHWMAQWGYR